MRVTATNDSLILHDLPDPGEMSAEECRALLTYLHLRQQGVRPVTQSRVVAVCGEAGLRGLVAKGVLAVNSRREVFAPDNLNAPAGDFRARVKEVAGRYLQGLAHHAGRNPTPQERARAYQVFFALSKRHNPDVLFGALHALEREERWEYFAHPDRLLACPAFAEAAQAQRRYQQLLLWKLPVSREERAAMLLDLCERHGWPAPPESELAAEPPAPAAEQRQTLREMIFRLTNLEGGTA